MANNKNFIAKNGVSTGDGYAMPDVRPSLLLDFANSKTLDPRITFTRGSTGTYWDGKTTTKAEENLHKYSQSTTDKGEFDLTLTNNSATAPDGTTTAMLLTLDSSGTGGPRVYGTDNTGGQRAFTSGETYTVSAYFKAGTATYCYISLRTTSSNIASSEFNLSTGSASTASATGTWSNASSTMTDVGNGWYRCTVTATAGATTTDGYNFFGVSDGTGIGSGGYPNITLSGQTVYLWGLQKEIRSSATAYTATTSTPIVKYQPTLQTAASGEARFDHDPVTGESKGLLIEEARTNLFPKSSEDTNFTYTNEVTLTDDFAIAPDGTQNAFLAQATTASSTHYFGIPQGIGSTSGNDTFSIHLKSYGVPNVTLVLANQSGSYSLVVNLDDGTITTSGVSNVSESMEDVGNGWYRISMSWAASKTNPYPTIRLLDSNDTSNWTGDGFSGVLVWGAQWEAGSFPTSFIPTSGSTVTRSADEPVVGNATLSGWYNTNEGTVLAKFRLGFNSDYDQRYIVSGGNGYARWAYTNSGDNNAVVSYDGTQTTVTNITSDNVTSTLASTSSLITLKKNLAVDGKLAAEVAATGDMNTLTTELRLGYYGSGTQLNGWLAKVAYYPIAFDRTTLAALTEA